MPERSDRVRSLSLKRFTAFEEAAFEFSPGINVLIGTNSTGKIHVIKTIYAVLRECRYQHREKLLALGADIFFPPVFRLDGATGGVLKLDIFRNLYYIASNLGLK